LPYQHDGAFIADVLREQQGRIEWSELSRGRFACGNCRSSIP